MKAAMNDSGWCSCMSTVRRNPLPQILSAPSQLRFITTERRFHSVSAVLRLSSVTRECQLSSFMCHWRQPGKRARVHADRDTVRACAAVSHLCTNTLPFTICPENYRKTRFIIFFLKKRKQAAALPLSFPFELLHTCVLLLSVYWWGMRDISASCSAKQTFAVIDAGRRKMYPGRIPLGFQSVGTPDTTDQKEYKKKEPLY